MQIDSLIEIRNAVPRMEPLAFAQPINWNIKNGQHWAIIGPNGCGKTLLTDILIGKHVLKSGEIVTENNLSINTQVKCVAFRDIYSLTDIQNSYYQQRWNSGDQHGAPLVRELFVSDDKQWLEILVAEFRIEDLLDKTVNLLSSGELRKVLVIRTLLTKPRVIIIDNPFIGLDLKSREILNDILVKLSYFENLQIVLVLSHPKDLPSIITHILPVKDKTLLPIVSRDEFLNDKDLQQSLFHTQGAFSINASTNKLHSQALYENALVFKNIHIKYGSRTILKDLNWTVQRGDKWALLGENGSGKSTLLSLVSGDNPQAYANDINLFDRKRGSGESIWDIKKQIGYISPEMHLYYLKNVPCIDVVGSGFFDTIGLYRKCNHEQKEIALQWMKILGIENIKDTSFLRISTGEQRLVLLARVFVKNPTLLILDEPLHGLDAAHKYRIKKIIEDFCTADKALIYVTHYEEEIPDIVTKRLELTKNRD